MDFDINTLAGEGIDISTGTGYTGSKEKYISALQRFFKSSAGNKEKISAHMANRDLESLMITVHALKSNSKMIGALGLSSMFEALELASKNGDLDTVEATLPKTLEEYERILTLLTPLGQMDTLMASGEIGAKEALKTASLVKKLAGYPFRITQREKLKTAAEYIGQFMYDEAVELIRQIIPAIE